ncbi:MAG: DNA polymerase III subunit alpha, partial [Desulfuromonas sp.]
VSEDSMRFGLGAVKGVGAAALDSILEVRKEETFESLHDFCERVDLRKVNKKVIEALVKCGAFASLGGKRSQYIAVLEEVMEGAQKLQKEKALGQESLFGAEEIVVAPGGHGHGQLPEMDEWAENVLLSFEKEALGFYITGHPLARHADAIKRFATCDSAGLVDRADKEEVRICGIVAGMKELMTKKGDRMAFVTLEDLSGSVEVVVFPETFAQASEELKGEEPLLASGTLDVGEETVKLMATEILTLREVKERLTRRVRFRLTTPGLDEDQLRSLRTVMERHRGNCESVIHLVIPNRSETVIALPEELKVAANDEIMDDTEKLFGYNVVTFE